MRIRSQYTPCSIYLRGAIRLKVLKLKKPELRESGRFHLRQQLVQQHPAATLGFLNQKITHYNSETLFLKLNDLFVYIKGRLVGEHFEAWLKYAKTTVVGDPDSQEEVELRSFFEDPSGSAQSSRVADWP